MIDDNTTNENLYSAVRRFGMKRISLVGFGGFRSQASGDSSCVSGGCLRSLTKFESAAL